MSKKDDFPGRKKNKIEDQEYRALEVEKDTILKQLKANGGRITRQRKILIDIILEKEFTNCKEIYYDVSKILPGIGMATIYRTIRALEEAGALCKSNIYRRKAQEPVKAEECLVCLEDDTLIRLDASSLNSVIEKGMEEKGYLNGKRVRTVLVQQGETETIG